MSTFVLKRLDSWSNNIQSLQQRFYTQNKAKEETRKLNCISIRVVILSHTPHVFKSPCFIKLIFCNFFSIHLFYFFFLSFFLPMTFTHSHEPLDLYPWPTTFSYSHSHAELRKDVAVKHFHFELLHSVPLNIKLEWTFLLLEGLQNGQLLQLNTSSPLWFPSAVFGKN